MQAGVEYQQDVARLCAFAIFSLTGTHVFSEKLDHDIPMIAIMGRAGAGKSTFIDRLGVGTSETTVGPMLDMNLQRVSTKSTQVSTILNCD